MNFSVNLLGRGLNSVENLIADSIDREHGSVRSAGRQILDYVLDRSSGSTKCSMKLTASRTLSRGTPPKRLSRVQPVSKLDRLLQDGRAFTVRKSPTEPVVLLTECKQTGLESIDLRLVASDNRVRCCAMHL